MSAVLIVAAILAVLALLMVLALGLAAKRADHGDQDTGWLMAFMSLRSPSGKPFFASRGDVTDFVKTVDEARGFVEERPRWSATTQPRGSGETGP